MHATSRRSRLVIAVATGALVGAGLFTASIAFAATPISLTGSTFEIDPSANLKNDNAGTWKDWADIAQGTVAGTEIRKQDSPSGTNDESFGQGTKEDTPVPSVVNGSIPPNKSDLKFFGVYQEGGSSTGFLNLYWSRVQDPSGTTNMDFEFNKNKCAPGTTGSACSSNNVTPLRSNGDLLITYDLSNGGTNPTLSLRTWAGNGTSGAWGTPVSLTGSGKATGSINGEAIPAGESDGLGAHSARTFGEAQIKLSEVLPAGTCTTFGSAYLKSRSSDSFTAAAKDFVPPAVVNITNCGSVKVIKTGGGTTRLNGVTFTLWNDLGTASQQAPTQTAKGAEDTVTSLACTTAGTAPAEEGTCTITNVPFGKYWLVEGTPPAGYERADDVAVTVVDASQVSVTVDNPVLDVPMTLSTQQRWLPNDRAVVTAGNNSWGSLSGKVHFELYENNTCSGTSVYSAVLDETTDDTETTKGGLSTTVLTSNTTVYTTAKTVSWKVWYDSDVLGQPDIDPVCDISVLQSVTNGNPVPGAP